MEWKVNNKYNGFKLIEERELKELNSIGRIFEHEKTGAQLLSLVNDDDNKVFGIGFRTPPEDSTGLPHILEHSVLCGSRKFPSKEPFVELLKGSLNTFLNAMTFPDKTIYPVASRNTKDFFNLMDVYLDAVLYPNIYNVPEIFKQEGWHYELGSENDELTYNGVVYNEMKGAFSSPDSLLSRRIQSSLFPDTAYGHESGGDPEDIPKLTYEQFISFHKKYYHPSNSYIFLYGDGDLNEQLRFINDEYLQGFDAITVDSEIGLQKPFEKVKEFELDYPAEDLKDNTYLSYNFVVGNSLDPELYIAFEILEHLLLETSAAPLKKAIIDAEIGKAVLGQFDNSIKQPVLSIVVKNSNEDQKENFKTVIFDTLKKLVNEGIDKEMVEASINKMEFSLREADFRGYPKGLIYYMKAFDSWLYGENPMLHFEYDPILEKIKSALTTNYFEKLIEKYILNNNHSSFVVLKPVKGILEAKEAELKKELESYKATLTEVDIKRVVQETKDLKERQATPDSPEVLAKLPALSLEDISKEAERVVFEEKNEAGIKVIFNPVFTNKIAYLNLVFNTDKVPQELLPYLGLLSSILGKISTKNYEYGDLSNQINIHTGGLSFSSRVFLENGSSDEFHPTFSVKSKALVEKMPKVVEFIDEILTNTKFDEKKRIREIIREVKSRFESVVYSSGHSISSMKVLSYFSPKVNYDEATSGLSYYKFISSIEKNFDEVWQDLSDKLKKTTEYIFNKNNLLINFVSDEEDYNSLSNNMDTILKGLGKAVLPKAEYKFQQTNANEGLLTQSKVQFVAKAGNFIKAGYKYNGSMQVLKTIAGYDYLWNKVRVLGGAYGVMSGFGRDGNTYIVSYRDPNVKETLQVYDEMEAYLRNFQGDEAEITKYIIGTISNYDFPLTPSMKGEVTVANYTCKVTYEEQQKERDEVLKTTAEDIRNFAKLLKDTLSQNYICVLGNDNKLKENKDLFNSLINVIEQ
jgi:Zn-dependent M16 (insulinase) family peptidase